MSEGKTITIPSQTEGRDPYQVKIPICQPRHRRRMRMYQAVAVVKHHEAALEETKSFLKKWEEDADTREDEYLRQKKELQDRIEACSFAGGVGELIHNLKREISAIDRSIADQKNEVEEKKRFIKSLEKEKAEVEEYFGKIPDWQLGEEHHIYLQIGKEVLSDEAWAVAACCGLDPDVWEDIGYEDYNKICKELLRRNPLFFRITKKIVEMVNQ